MFHVGSYNHEIKEMYKQGHFCIWEEYLYELYQKKPGAGENKLNISNSHDHSFFKPRTKINYTISLFTEKLPHSG